MNLTKLAIDNKIVSYFSLVLIIIAGLLSFFSLGQLEDPEFTVKSALIQTSYPGASPKEVESEVTDKIEKALQEMPELKSLHSISRAGESIIKVDIKAEYWSDKLPQVWDQLRRKINDIQEQLPPGSSKPRVADDFGDVFGLLLAITGDGFSYKELEKYAKSLQKEINLVDGVARVELWGSQQKVIYVEVSEEKIAKLGLNGDQIQAILNQQNLVLDGGHINTESQRYRIVPSGQFTKPEDIANVLIKGQVSLEASQLIRIADFAKVYEGYQTPAYNLMRFNGKPALSLAISNISGANIVDMGKRVDQLIANKTQRLPVGIEVNKIHWQSDVVSESISTFLINFLEALLIVLAVLTFTMGWRMGLVIGTALVITIMATFTFMAMFSIDIHRMSLGALIIALGMMVDNSIVVAEGYVVRLQKGEKRQLAAINSAKQPSFPLLGATIIAVMAFYPIFASVEDAGEYCRTLFIVVAVSLLTSWLISITITPLQCMDLLKAEKQLKGKESGGILLFRHWLNTCLKHRVITSIAMLSLLTVSIFGFGQIKQIFFPESAMTKFMVDIWSPEGTKIERVEDSIKKIEGYLLNDERVVSIGSFIGQGPPRFYLPVDPELPYSSFGQVIVNVSSLDELKSVASKLETWLPSNTPESLTRVRRYSVGPGNTWKFEARFSGPADADPIVLRSLAQQGEAILRSTHHAKHVRNDWRQQQMIVVPQYSQDKGRWSNISRQELANSTKRAFDGVVIGQYREDDSLFPIVLRRSETPLEGLQDLRIQPSQARYTAPLSQITNGIELKWENPIIWRFNQRRAITVQASPQGITFTQLRSEVIDQFNEIELPPGYSLEWDGEYDSTTTAQQSLIPGVIPAVVIILFILVALFNAIRPMLIILLTIPFSIIGISFGLLATNTPFGFLALLGAMSLAGMMIKNAVVLLDQIEIEKQNTSKSAYDALVDATVSRVRPVLLAVATTVLGVIPLIPDVFWQGLAASVMGGLSFGTLITLFLVPVLYSIFYKVKIETKNGAEECDTVKNRDPLTLSNF